MMRETRHTTLKKGTKNPQVVKDTVSKPSAIMQADEEEETAYDCLLKKVNENRKRRKNDSKMVKAKKSKKDTKTMHEEPIENEQSEQEDDDEVQFAKATFLDGDNFVDMEVDGQQTEFLSQSEDEDEPV